MKKLFLTLLLVLSVAPSAFAHTQLSSTSPAQGDVVTTPLTEISLTYAGTIEEGSLFKLTNAAGEEIKIESITVLNGVMTGTIAEPLANDAYTVKWDSISADGHPLNGTFSFTVNVAQAEQPVTTEAPSNDTAENDTAVTNEDVDTADSSKEPVEESSNTPLLIIAGILVLIIIASTVVLFTRRKG